MLAHFEDVGVIRIKAILDCIAGDVQVAGGIEHDAVRIPKGRIQNRLSRGEGNVSVGQLVISKHCGDDATCRLDKCVDDHCCQCACGG